MRPTVTLPDGTVLPSLGLGTWHMGEAPSRRAAEVAAIRFALELGYRVFDSAEMYGDGGAEEVLGQALADAQASGVVRRDEVFVVSKVYPHNASRQGTQAACERSRRRLGLDRIDLYLLHWRGSIALADTVAGFESLQASGRIGNWGVSNFDTDDLAELAGVPGGGACAANQVYYSISERGPEVSLLPAQRRCRMPLMAYCPIDQGALAGDSSLHRIGARLGVSAAQVALAWVCSQPGVLAIPKAVQPRHLQDNWAAPALTLDAADRAELEQRFPAPRTKRPLAMV